MSNSTKQGVLFALGAYGLWAIAPIYFKVASNIEPLKLLSHRVVWSLALTLIIIVLTGRSAALMTALKQPKTRVLLLLSTLLIGLNWWVFIWAIQQNQMLNASLGYYINPLINILLGMVFFADRLDRPKKIAAILCLIAVGFEIYQFGKLPWVALALAMSFALYGLVRKKLGVDSFIGMALETGLLLPAALGYLLFTHSPTSNLLTNPVNLNVLLFLAGPVTMVPLLCFAAAANRISLTTLGFFQYIGPSGMFLLAVFVYGEPIGEGKLITFSIIWCALLLLVWDSLKTFKRHSKLKTE